MDSHREPSIHRANDIGLWDWASEGSGNTHKSFKKQVKKGGLDVNNLRAKSQTQRMTLNHTWSD